MRLAEMPHRRPAGAAGGVDSTWASTPTIGAEEEEEEEEEEKKKKNMPTSLFHA